MVNGRNCDLERNITLLTEEEKKPFNSNPWMNYFDFSSSAPPRFGGVGEVLKSRQQGSERDEELVWIHRWNCQPLAN